MSDKNAIALLRDLRPQGMPEGQAELLVTAITTQANRASITKTDLAAGFASAKRDLAETKRDLEGSLANTKRGLEGSIAALHADMATGFTRVEGRFAQVNARFSHVDTKLDLILAQVEVSNTVFYDRLLKRAMFATLGVVGVLITAPNLLLTGCIRFG